MARIVLLDLRVIIERILTKVLAVYWIGTPPGLSLFWKKQICVCF